MVFLNISCHRQKSSDPKRNPTRSFFIQISVYCIKIMILIQNPDFNKHTVLGSDLKRQCPSVEEGLTQWQVGSTMPRGCTASFPHPHPYQPPSLRPHLQPTTQPPLPAVSLTFSPCEFGSLCWSPPTLCSWREAKPFLSENHAEIKEELSRMWYIQWPGNLGEILFLACVVSSLEGQCS